MTRREVLDIISEYNISANIAISHRQNIPPRIALKMANMVRDGYAETVRHVHDEIIMDLTEKGQALPYD